MRVCPEQVKKYTNRATLTKLQKRMCSEGQPGPVDRERAGKYHCTARGSRWIVKKFHSQDFPRSADMIPT